MEIRVERYSDNGNSTQGLVFVDGKFFCHCLEDEFREEKVKGETRIPEGKYRVGLREVVSPMAEKYRKRFPDFFEFHIQVKDVPGFDYIYIHVGNKESHTDGCLLIGDSQGNNRVGSGFCGNSGAAFERFYNRVYPLLKAGKEVSIEYIDRQ